MSGNDSDLTFEEPVEVSGVEEGERIGRFLVLRDIEGRKHAVSAGAVAAPYETDEGTILLLPGGKMTHVPRSMYRVLKWLDGRC